MMTEDEVDRALSRQIPLPGLLAGCCLLGAIFVCVVAAVMSVVERWFA